MTTIGIVHPGQMGSTIGATASAGATVIWAGDGRSAASFERAEAAGMTDVGSVETLCRQADIIVSICPPAAAVSVARQVTDTGFTGPFVDANAISPMTAGTIADLVPHYVDGGVIGPPAKSAGTTRMYLAGPGASELAGHWAGSVLDVVPMSDSAVDAPASSLKMSYAAWTKGQSALLLAVNSLAGSAGVLDALRQEWGLSQPGLAERSEAVAAAVSPKAWRFSGEMAEIADTMAKAGLPDGFHRGAEELYRRMADFKDTPNVALSQVIDQVTAEDQTNR